MKFSYVLEKIKPLEREQAKLQRNLKLAEDQIGQLSSGLEEVDAQVAVLKERLNKGIVIDLDSGMLSKMSTKILL